MTEGENEHENLMLSPMNPRDYLDPMRHDPNVTDILAAGCLVIGCLVFIGAFIFALVVAV